MARGEPKMSVMCDDCGDSVDFSWRDITWTEMGWTVPMPAGWTTKWEALGVSDDVCAKCAKEADHGL